MTIPRLFGPYGSAALAQVDTLAAYGANACWFHMFDDAAFEICARVFADAAFARVFQTAVARIEMG